MEQFKIRASQASKLMGKVGLTEKQEETLLSLLEKPKHTITQAKNIEILSYKKENPELPDTATSYLKEWYSEFKTGVNREIKNKYLDKGNFCENESISVIAERLGYGWLKKNTAYFENDLMCGTPDILIDCVIDAKTSWDHVTFLNSVTSDLNYDYYCQLQVYMHLTGLKSAKLCYVLLDTPFAINYGTQVVWSHIPVKERFYTQTIEYDHHFINDLYNRVVMARNWLYDYDTLVCAKLGLI